jgi:valyl-tRNA synthetase
VGGMEIYILLGGLVDLDQEKERMGKRINEINRLITGINGKLSNDNFVKRAPEQVVVKERSNLKKLTEEFDKVTANLEMLQ